MGEILEQFCLLLRCHSDAAVGDCKLDPVASVRHPAHPERDLASMRELLACPDSKGVLGTLGILNVFVCPPLRSLFRNVRPSTRLLS